MLDVVADNGDPAVFAMLVDREPRRRELRVGERAKQPTTLNGSSSTRRCTPPDSSSQYR